MTRISQLQKSRTSCETQHGNLSVSQALQLNVILS